LVSASLELYCLPLGGFRHLDRPLSNFLGCRMTSLRSAIQLRLAVGSSYPGLDTPQDQSNWLSFTAQTEGYLYVGLMSFGKMVAANGSEYTYYLSTWFNFSESPTTFYRFSYPVAAWLGYGSSIFVGALSSLGLLVHVARAKTRKKKVGLGL
jgi:hypothetical protein